MKKIKNVLLMLMVLVISGMIGAKAATLIESSQVIYKNDKTVDNALDELFENINNNYNKNLRYDEENGYVQAKTTGGDWINITALSSLPLADLIIYDSGNINVPLTSSGYNFAYNSTAYTNSGVSTWTPNIPISITGSYAVGTVFGTTDVVDVSAYNILYVTIDGTEYSLDISDLTGTYYVWVAFSRYADYSSNSTLNAGHLAFGVSSSKNCVSSQVAWYHTTTSSSKATKYVSKIQLSI